MESLSGCGQVGIGIRGCTLPDRELRLAWALESASLAVLDGAGTTGDMIGITTISVSAATATYPTAESSPITTPSIMRTSIMAEDSRAAVLVEIRGSMDQPLNMDLQLRNMDLPRRMWSLVVIPARSEALVMEGSLGGSRLAGSRASAAA